MGLWEPKIGIKHITYLYLLDIKKKRIEMDRTSFFDVPILWAEKGVTTPESTFKSSMKL